MSDELHPLPLNANSAIAALRAIFWGGMICVIDIKTNGFDVANDVLGMALICWGVFALANEDGGPGYGSSFAFVKPVSIAVLVANILEHFRLPASLAFLFTIVGLFGLAAIHVFCVAMGKLCQHHGLHGSATSWATTKLLFVLIYEIPLGLNYLAALLAFLAGESYEWHFSGDWVFLLIAVFFVPLIHLFISTSRSKREIRGRMPGSTIESLP